MTHRLVIKDVPLATADAVAAYLNGQNIPWSFDDPTQRTPLRSDASALSQADYRTARDAIAALLANAEYTGTRHYADATSIRAQHPAAERLLDEGFINLDAIGPLRASA